MISYRFARDDAVDELFFDEAPGPFAFDIVARDELPPDERFDEDALRDDLCVDGDVEDRPARADLDLPLLDDRPPVDLDRDAGERRFVAGAITLSAAAVIAPTAAPAAAPLIISVATSITLSITCDVVVFVKRGLFRPEDDADAFVFFDTDEFDLLAI